MEDDTAHPGPARSKDEIALELMKFVAVTTGYGKGAPSAGYAGRRAGRPKSTRRRSCSSISVAAPC